VRQSRFHFAETRSMRAFSICNSKEVTSGDRQQESAAEFASGDSIRPNNRTCGFAIFYVRYQTL